MVMQIILVLRNAGQFCLDGDATDFSPMEEMILNIFYCWVDFFFF